MRAYAPVRAARSAKAGFIVSPSLDRAAPAAAGLERVLGHPLELAPEANPASPMGPGVPIGVRRLYRGKPLANERVSFIPRGEALAGGVDQRYTRMTDDQGRASFELRDGNL